VADLEKFKIQISIAHQLANSESYDPLYLNNQVVEKLKEIERLHGRRAKTAYIMEAIMNKILEGRGLKTLPQPIAEEAAGHQASTPIPPKWGASLDGSMKIM